MNLLSSLDIVCLHRMLAMGVLEGDRVAQYVPAVISGEPFDAVSHVKW